MAEEKSLWQRALTKEPKAIIAVTIISVFTLFFFIAFGFDAADTSVSHDFGVSFVEQTTVTFPTFSLRAWGDDYFDLAACRVCHWKIPNEICRDQPAISAVIVQKQNLNQPTEIQFNGDGSVVGDINSDPYVICNWQVQKNGATLYIYDGPSRPSSEDRPVGELSLGLPVNSSAFISLRRIVTKWNNGSQQIDFERLNNDLTFSKETPNFRLYYGTYYSTYYRQNSPEQNKQNFWSFMGEIGGTAFLFYCMYTGIMMVLTLLVFRDT